MLRAVVFYDDVALAPIPGWFWKEDIHLFQWLLADQRSRGVSGDLVEIGAYQGKSTVVIGANLAPGEELTVVDLFDAPAFDSENEREMAEQYSSLTRQQFEANYLRFHDRLPRVFQALSSTVTQYVAPHSVRFMHVDGSHLYEHVKGDAEAARALLVSQGVVAFDDYRSPHTPGTAAAVWEAVLTRGLRPFVVTNDKLYGSWGPVDELRERLLASIRTSTEWEHEVQEVAGHQVVRMWQSARPLSLRVVGRLKREVAARLPQRPTR